MNSKKTAPVEVDSDVLRRDRVIIAAAVAAVVGPAAIRGIKPLPVQHHGAWMREGREGIQSSHGGAPSVTRPATRGRD
jgi:hypothetical protein